MTKDHGPELATYSVPEAGRILGVGRDAAYEAAARGEIPVIRIGRLRRVPKTALERMLESGGLLDGPSSKCASGANEP